MNHLRKYVEYIRNTGHDPLPTLFFDEDWEPIGPTVRADMVRAGLVEVIDHDSVRLTDAGRALLSARDEG